MIFQKNIDIPQLYSENSCNTEKRFRHKNKLLVHAKNICACNKSPIAHTPRSKAKAYTQVNERAATKKSLEQLDYEFEISIACQLSRIEIEGE